MNYLIILSIYKRVTRMKMWICRKGEIKSCYRIYHHGRKGKECYIDTKRGNKFISVKRDCFTFNYFMIAILSLLAYLVPLATAINQTLSISLMGYHGTLNLVQRFSLNCTYYYVICFVLLFACHSCA
jgi:hypothetical protein